MDRSTAREFWDDVEDALDDYFDDDSFYSTKKYIEHDDGTPGATIEIIIDYDSVPEDIDDIFCEVEDAVDEIDWEYDSDWDGNTYVVTYWEED